MIKEEEYLKAKQIVQEYEKQLNISVVMNTFSKKDLKKAFDAGEIAGRFDDLTFKEWFLENYS